MPIYEFECDCGNQAELIIGHNESVTCIVCGREMKKLFPSSTSFRLKYDPKKDKVDWNGNTTQRYREVKKNNK